MATQEEQAFRPSRSEYDIPSSKLLERNPRSESLRETLEPSLPTASVLEFMHRCSVFICLSRLRIYGTRREGGTRG